MRFVTFAVFASFVLPNASAGQDQLLSESTAFVDVNVVPMDREMVLEHRTVIVADGRIRRIGAASEVEIPADAERIDGTGRYLLPGLADMHVHVWNEDHLDLLLANGVTTVRNMWGAPLHQRWQEEIETGKRISPTIFTTGPLMDGPGATWGGSTILETVEQAKKEVRRQAAAGYRALKVYDRLSKAVYRAISETARELDLPVWGHVPIDVGLEGVLRAGQSCNEHLTGYLAATLADDSPLDPRWLKLPEPVFLERYASIGRQVEAGEIGTGDVIDSEKLESLASATREAGLWNVPTLALAKATWATSAGEVHAALAGPSMRYLDHSTSRRWDEITSEWGEMISAADVQGLELLYESRVRILQALHEAGARILLGTDTPNPLMIPGFSLHEELRVLVASGLTPYEVLRAGTADAAELLGATDEWGTVAEGRRADLILLAENPLEDVSHAARPLGVMIRGRWLPETSLQEKLDTLARRYATQEDFLKAVLAGDLEAAWTLLETSREASEGEGPIGEAEVDRAGHALLDRKETAAANEVFERNAQEHPRSSNAWDGLAEAYLLDGQTEKAIQHYERSLELDPGNSNARSKLLELRRRSSDGR